MKIFYSKWKTKKQKKKNAKYLLDRTRASHFPQGHKGPHDMNETNKQMK